MCVIPPFHSWLQFSLCHVFEIFTLVKDSDTAQQRRGCYTYQTLNTYAQVLKQRNWLCHLHVRHYEMNLFLTHYALPFYSLRTELWLHRGSLTYEIGVWAGSKKTTSIWWKSTYFVFLWRLKWDRLIILGKCVLSRKTMSIKWFIKKNMSERFSNSNIEVAHVKTTVPI